MASNPMSIGDEQWTLATNGTTAWANAKTEMLVLAVWSVNERMYGTMHMIIPKIELSSEKNTSFNLGDRYDTGSQHHLQIDISTSGYVSATLYENANAKSGVSYYFYYR